MIKRYCDRCGQQIDEGVHAWYVLELHGTDGEFRHKELCEECYAYLCEKDEVPMPQTDDKCIGCKLTDGEYCYCPEECEVCDRNEPQTDNGIGCSRCEGRFDCYDRDMPHAVRCNNYGKITDEPQTVRSNLEPFRVDEPQTEMTTEQIVNELLSIKKILDDGKLPKQRCGNPHDMVCDKWERSE